MHKFLRDDISLAFRTHFTLKFKAYKILILLLYSRFAQWAAFCIPFTHSKNYAEDDMHFMRLKMEGFLNCDI